jgi:hypothetical protein
MKKIALFALITGAACLVACSSDDNNNNDGGKDGSTNDVQTNDVQTNDASDSGGNPAPPTLKTQVDRMGRPAINTALNHVFDTTSAAGTAKDAYNADSVQTHWTTYVPEFASNLGIFDALDKTCGNAAGFAIAGTYNTLGGLAADDRLYLKTDATTCTTYLAVELNATNIQANADCGGRKLNYDVIDLTYGAVSGVLTGVPDGISADTTKTGGTTFPYLAPAP